MSIPLNYASPRPAALDGVPECRRVVKGNDEWLVMQDGGSTPDRCICCNEPAGGYLQRVKYPEPRNDSTVRRAGNFGQITGLLVLFVAVVQLFVTIGHVATRRTWVVHFAVCENCRKRARRDRWLATVAAALGTALIAVAVALILSRLSTERWASLATLAGGAIGVGLLIVAALTVSLTYLPELDRIAQEQIWFKQVEKKFLDSLPIVEPQGRANVDRTPATPKGT